MINDLRIQQEDTLFNKDEFINRIKKDLTFILLNDYPHMSTWEEVELSFNGNYIDLYHDNILVRKYREDGYMDCFFEECAYQKLSQRDIKQITILRCYIEELE